MISKTGLICVLLSMVLWSCHKPQSDQDKNSAVSGEVVIAVDESLAPFATAEVEAFEATYPNASIRLRVCSEKKVFDLFLADSVQTIVVTRKLSTEEEAVIHAQNYISKHTKVAHDALVMIVNPDHGLSRLDSTVWQAILSGENDENLLVFDSEGSGTLRMIRKNHLVSDTIPSYFKAGQNTPEVVSFLTEMPNAIGLVGRSWISEKHDSLTANFLKSVKILSLQAADGNYYQPYQAYIAQETYPLIRDVIIITREAYTGLGTGFVAYVAGDKGQRVALKSGLVPATMPVRLVQFSDKNSDQ